jgi:ubiquinone/menaquinone biosynthesis C-methylase UbiE
MGIYRDWLLPPILDLVMRQEALAKYRCRAQSEAQGTVLEVGVGSGLNLPLYGAGVERVIGIDPSARLLHTARRRAAKARVPVHLVMAAGEALPVADASVDTVVTTWTLCTIPDPLAALGEMRRVLRAGGRLLFVEHGLAPDPQVQRWQQRLTPGWRRIGGGCHLNRKMDELIKEAGFEIGDLGTGYMDGPKALTFMYRGWAVSSPPSSPPP